MIQLLIALSTDSSKLMEMKRDPDAFLAGTALSETEKSVIKNGDSDGICQILASLGQTEMPVKTDHLIQLLISLSTDSSKLMEMKRDPDAFLAGTDLSESEKSVIKHGDSEGICQILAALGQTEMPVKAMQVSEHLS